MTAHDPVATAGLSTAGLSLQVSADPHLSLSLVAQPQGDPLCKTEQARGCPVALVLPGRRLAGDDFAVSALFAGHDAVVATCAAGDVELRLSWTPGPAGALRLLIQARTTADGALLDGELALTFLAHLHPGDLAHAPRHDPGHGPLAADGRPFVRAGHYPLPYMRWCPTGGVAVLARYATDVSHHPRWQPVPSSLPVRLRAQWLDVCELTIVACAAGWPGAFAALRDQVRAGLDLAAYQRPDGAWYRDQWLQHFTFLYGREVFDHAGGRLDVDRLLDDGARFGGYDGVLLWPAYPRLGVDERSQWDFYDDLPGGRAALRALAERARARATRVFIPYLPWDSLPDSRHGIPAAAPAELARVVADIGADGVFLDTIGSIAPQFRQAIDRARPGVVFCAEMQPGLDQIATITGSWDQAEHRHAGEIDLLRFLFPEHPRFMINRHAIGAQRERVIRRALLNGTGLVVWQDIFGEVLPYTDREAALVHDTAMLLRRYAGCFRGVDALPLIPAAHAEVLANAFVAADGQAVVTLHNAGEETVEGDLIAWAPSSAAGLRWMRVDPALAAAGVAATVTDVPRDTLPPGGAAVFAGAPADAPAR